MTRMKNKIIASTLISAAMLMSLASPVYAATENGNTQQSSQSSATSSSTELKRENVYFNVYDAQTKKTIATHVYGGYLLGTGDYRKSTGSSEAHVTFPQYAGYTYGHPFSPQLYYDGAAQVEYNLYLIKKSALKNQQPQQNTHSATHHAAFTGKESEGNEAQYLKQHPSEMERCKRENPGLIKTLIKDGMLTAADVNKPQKASAKKNKKNKTKKEKNSTKHNVTKAKNKKNSKPDKATSHHKTSVGGIIATIVVLLIAAGLIVKGVMMMRGKKNHKKYKHMR